MQDDLTAVLDVAEQPLARLPVLMDHTPDDWIHSAVALSGKASIRRRRLPPDMVLWLVIGMALFRSEPITEVARRPNICADGLANEDLLAKSSLSHARQRLGQQPAEWLFKRCAQARELERYPEGDWHGLQVFVAYGALFRTQDTPERREHFGSGNASAPRQTPYPMPRLATLMSVRSHVLLDAAVSPYRKGEIPQAQGMRDALPDYSVTLFDKGFFSADLLLGLQAAGQNRHCGRWSARRSTPRGRSRKVAPIWRPFRMALVRWLPARYQSF